MIIQFFGEPISLRELFSDSAVLRGSELRNEANRVFGNREKAMQWVARPNRALDYRPPLSVAAKSDEGLKRVRDILGRIEHGIHS